MTEDALEHILEKLEDGQNKMIGVLEANKVDLEKLITLHEDKHHPPTVPKGSEVLARGAGMFRRIDSIWDKMFTTLAVFIMILVGYGLLVMISSKTALLGLGS